MNILQYIDILAKKVDLISLYICIYYNSLLYIH